MKRLSLEIIGENAIYTAGNILFNPNFLNLLTGFVQIVEERYQRDQGVGRFVVLDGSGKPLCLENDQHISEDLRICHKILKNADCLPPELEIKKEIRQTETLLAGMKDTAEKYHILKKINFLIMKCNAMANGSIKLEIPQRYGERLVERLDRK
mgnify:CR=1 FL=1